jgi:hypothetical protein
MLIVHSKKTKKKMSLLKNAKRDKFLNTLIERRTDALDKTLQELVEKNNPTLQSIMKVEKLFKKHIEFASRSELSRELKGSMKPPVLNTIIVRLVSENKLIVNNDRSLTWIDIEGNEKLNKLFREAVPL